MSTPALEDQREKLRRALEAATAAGETGAPGAKELVESCGTALQAFDTAHPEVKVALEAKAKAAMENEREKLDMKTRVKCGICRRTVSQHCLLYSHKCSKDALDARPQTATVEEKYAEPEPPEPKRKAPSQEDLWTVQRFPEEYHCEPIEYPPPPLKTTRLTFKTFVLLG